MPIRQLGVDDLPEELQEQLEEYMAADDRYKEVVNHVKETYPDAMQSVMEAHVDRDTRVERLKKALKAYVQSEARDDASVGRSDFGPFQVTPQRKRHWDTDAFQDAVEELGIYQQCIDHRIIIQIEEGHVNVAKARELGILQNLIDTGVVALEITYSVDGTRAEDMLDGEQFEQLRRAAWREELRTVACQAPPPSSAL